MSKSSQRQFLVKVGDIVGYWMTKAGGGISANVTKAYDGGDPDPDLISAPPEVDNITVTRVYDPLRDSDMKESLKRAVGRFTCTITVTPTDQDYVAVAPPDVYSPCLLVGFKLPDVDAASGDAAPIELEFAVGTVR
jgi:hypothetical protein